MDLGSAEIWAIVGVLLLIVELLTISFFSMFFGIGALATALLTYLNITEGITSQVLVFVLISLASIVLFRKQLRELFNRKGEVYQEMINERAKVSMTIPPKGEGKVFYRGADWIAENLHHETIEAGSQVIIKKVDGIRLLVEPE
jgi:membrane protein implicated in regulation of membrane protease activity